MHLNLSVWPRGQVFANFALKWKIRPRVERGPQLAEKDFQVGVGYALLGKGFEI